MSFATRAPRRSASHPTPRWPRAPPRTKPSKPARVLLVATDEYASYAACLGGTLDEVTKCPDLGVEMDARLRGRCHSENRFLQRCLTGIDPDLVDAGADASGDAAP